MGYNVMMKNYEVVMNMKEEHRTGDKVTDDDYYYCTGGDWDEMSIPQNWDMLMEV